MEFKMNVQYNCQPSKFTTLSFEKPRDVKHAQLSSIFVRFSTQNKMYVGITFNSEKGNKVQHRLKKHGIKIGDNAKASGKYETKNIDKIIELVKMAAHDRLISDYDLLLALNKITDYNPSMTSKILDAIK